jgi:16S rRNA processing protein RimM
MDKAMLLKNKTLYALREDFALEEGEFFLADMIGLDVIDADSGENYGKLTEIMNRGASDIYVVTTKNGERMIPAVDEFIISVDVEKGVFVRVIEGMLD